MSFRYASESLLNAYGTTWARARLHRAREHILEFHRDARNFVRSGAYQLVREQDVKGEQAYDVFKFKVVGGIPYSLAITFGESVNQLRAPCDNLITALQRIYGVTGKEKLGFPIFEHSRSLPGSGSAGFEGWTQRLAKRSGGRLPAALLSFLEGLQPYKTYVGPKGARAGSNHPLTILHALWNEDKHESPLELSCLNASVEATFRGGVKVSSKFGPDADEAYVRRCEARDRQFAMGITQSIRTDAFNADGVVQTGPVSSFAGRVIEDGMEYMRIAIDPNQPIGDLRAQPVIDVTLDKSGDVAPGQIAKDLLIELHDFVSHEVVDGLAPFFP